MGNIFLAVIMALSIFGQGHFDIFSHTSNAEKSITLKFEAADHHHGLVEVVGSLSHHHDLVMTMIALKIAEMFAVYLAVNQLPD